jgi:hypothetical protein
MVSEQKRGYWTSSIKSRIFSGNGITGPITCFLRSWKAALTFLKPLLMKSANMGQPCRKFETGFMNCSGRWNLFPKKSSLMFSRKTSYVSWNPGFPIADVKSVAKLQPHPLFLFQGAISYLPKEMLADLDTLLNELLDDRAKGQPPWRLLFDKLGKYFDERFGTGWKEKDKAFWSDFSRNYQIGKGIQERLQHDPTILGKGI